MEKTEGKNKTVMIMSEVSGNTVRQGFGSEAIALWVALRVGDAAAKASKYKEATMFGEN